MQRKYGNCSNSCEREYTTQSAQGAVVIDRMLRAMQSGPLIAAPDSSRLAAVDAAAAAVARVQPIVVRGPRPKRPSRYARAFHHLTANCVRFLHPVFCSAALMRFRTVPSLMNAAAEIPRLSMPSATRLTTSYSRSVSPGKAPLQRSSSVSEDSRTGSWAARGRHGLRPQRKAPARGTRRACGGARPSA